MIYAAILAGGSGKRFGADLPKQFVKLNGEEIILHTVRTFYNCGLFDKILICVSANYVDFTKELLHLNGISADVVIGGRERFESLELCCKHISNHYGITEDDILISQDSVRPFTTADMIADCIDGVQECGFATAAISAVDTIVQQTENGISVPDRSSLYCIQTPQGFFIEEFIGLYSSLDESEKNQLTDASRVYILNNRPVKFSLGNRLNIKITSREDMLLGNAILSDISDMEKNS